MEHIIVNTLSCLVFIVFIKSIFIGSDFNFLLWIKYKSKYINWYKNQDSFSQFLLKRRIRLDKAPKRFFLISSDVYETLSNNTNFSERYLDIGELKIETGSAIVFIEQNSSVKNSDANKQLGRYITYVVSSINLAAGYYITSKEGYYLTTYKRIATLLPVVD